MHDSSSPQVVGFYSQPYNEIVKPEQIWPVSKYFLRRWTPYLNPTRFWAVIAARQLAFRFGDKHRFACYDAQFYQEACASRANFYRIKTELEQTHSPISLFVSREPVKYHRQDDVTKPGPTTYYVRLDDVLTPGDAFHLGTWLQAQQPDRRPEAVADLLQQAITQPVTDLLAPSLTPYLADPPAKFQAITVADVVGRVFGPKVGNDVSVRRAADALHHYLMTPVFIGSQYFRRHWLDRLGAGPALLLTYLRSQCYRNEDTGEIRDQITFTRPELADALGVDRVTLFRWLKKIDEQTSPEQPFLPFLELMATHKTASNEVESTYRIQLHDPLIPEHRPHYHERIKTYPLTPVLQNETHTQGINKPTALQNETHKKEAIPQSELQNETHTGTPNKGTALQNETLIATLVADCDSHQGTTLQNETSYVAILDSYKYLSTLVKALERKGGKPFATTAATTSDLWPFWKLENRQATASFAQVTVGDVEGFCQATHIQGRRSRDRVLKGGLTVEQLVAWYLYVLRQKGIAPEARPGYIINRAAEGESPPKQFHDLAMLSWELWRCYACLLELPPYYRQYLQHAPGYEAWMAQYGQTQTETLPLGVGVGVYEVMSLMGDDEVAELGDDGPGDVQLPETERGRNLTLELPTEIDRSNWRITLGELKLQMTKATFNAWLQDTQLLGRENGAYIIGVRNEYARDWLTNRLFETIERTLVAVADEQLALRFIVWNPDSDAVIPTA